MALPRAKLGVSLFRHPCRKPLPRGEGLCMLGWLCISAIVVVCCRCVLHRLCSTTCMRPCIEPLGIYARHPCRGYITGATAPSPCRGLRPKARMLWLLAKSFARCKTSRASNTRHPFFIAKSFFDRLIIYLLYNGIVRGSFGKNEKCLKFYLKGLRKAEKYVILIVYGN